MPNPFALPGNWYKANLHTHTNRSDAWRTPEQVCDEYRLAGYALLAITDHNRVTDVTHLSADGFVVVRGAEIDGGKGELGTSYHVVGIDLPADYAMPPKDDPQGIINSILAAGGFCFLAHPYWSSQTVHDLLPLTGHIGVEVYNYSCRNIGKAANEEVWDDLLIRGRRPLGFAVDDAHWHNPDSRGAWIMVKAEEPSKQALLRAIREGAFYSSTGPRIRDFGIAEGRAYAVCSPAQQIVFVCDGSRGYFALPEGDEPLTRAEVRLSGGEKYVRLQVTDWQGRRAWSNPLFL
jgi:hypothetical protein